MEASFCAHRPAAGLSLAPGRTVLESVEITHTGISDGRREGGDKTGALSYCRAKRRVLEGLGQGESKWTAS